MKKQRRLTYADFERFILSGRVGRRGPAVPVQVYVTRPFEIVRCVCRDVNCHGWRLVPEDTARQVVREFCDVFTNPESVVDVRDLLRTAKQVV